MHAVGALHFARRPSPADYLREREPSSGICHRRILAPSRGAKGFFYLGLIREACAELAAAEQTRPGSPEAELLRLRKVVVQEDWVRAASIAEHLVSFGFRESAVFILGAHAIRRSRELSEALAFLLGGEPDLQSNAVFHFNAGCYLCQLGDLPAAEGRLANAFRLDPQLRRTARDDEDLAALRSVLPNI